ncbi:MAG TPA: FGGY-family carbohydrate kinase, partial [Rectinemataceae bacterium]|nr:FGGY-family carbohydrate kinase [Rectinemataceae bacterium]
AGYALATHYAHRMAGSVPASARRIGGICEFVAEGLVGAELGLSDPSCLASYGAWEVSAGAFDAELLDELLGPGSPAYFAPAPPVSVAGLWMGRVPVAFPVGDNQAGFHGLVADPLSACLVNLGTSGQLSFFSPEPKPAPGMELRPFLNRGYLQVGATLCGGKAWEILEEFLRSAAELVTSHRVESEAVYAAMEALASSEAEGGEALRVLPSFGGTRADPSRRGAILGIGLDNLRPGNMVRALVAGVVEELRGFSGGLGGDFGRMERIVATGGFARRVAAVPRALAEGFGLSVGLSGAEDGSAIGAALIGAEAAGLIDAAAVSRIVSSLPLSLVGPRQRRGA